MAWTTGATTWTAHVIAREGQSPLSGVTLRVKLLSPDMVPENLALITDDAGRAGPIDVDYERHPAAEVNVDPGPRWAGHFTTVLFVAGQAGHAVIELAPPATLSVRVMDHLAGAPLPGADVTVRDASGVVASVVSDHHGLAHIPWELSGGPFSIGAAANGFSPLLRAELARPPSSDLEIELLLAPAGVLNVQVQDEAGQSIVGLDAGAVTADPIRGSLQAFSPASGVRHTLARWDSPVEESGVFVFPSVPRGTMLVVRAVLSDGRAGQAFVRVPAPPGVAEATIVIAGAAGTEVWTFDDRGGALGGVAIGAGGEKLGTTDESGRLDLALQELAPQELWAHKEGYALGWQPWEPGLSSMIYHLPPERLTSGTVVDASDQPQRWVRVTPLLGTREEPYEARRLRGELVTSKRARTDASGAFELHGLDAGWVDLHVRPPKQGSFEVRDVMVGAQGILIRIPDVSTLGTEQGIALSIVILDEVSGEPVSGASVTAFHAQDPASKSSKDARSGKTGADGTVRLISALEGYFWVTAHADGYVPFSGPVVEYSVGEHAVEVRLSPSAELEISLVDQAGVGLQGYWIRALGQDGVLSFEHVEVDSGAQYSSSEVITDVQGRARANRMAPGRLVLEVRDGPGVDRKALVRKEIELIAGEKTQVELQMP